MSACSPLELVCDLCERHTFTKHKTTVRELQIKPFVVLFLVENGVEMLPELEPRTVTQKKPQRGADDLVLMAMCSPLECQSMAVCPAATLARKHSWPFETRTHALDLI